MKPFSQACANNSHAILTVLQRVLADSCKVLEIGSGTGQHAVHFAGHLSHLTWQTSDLPDNHAGINAWLADYSGANLMAPFALDVTASPWPALEIDAVFSANTAHIMSWSAVQAMFDNFKNILPTGAVLALYGPFNYNGDYTSDSNRNFDVWLKTQAPHRAIRDFEAVNKLAAQAGLALQEDNEMPANNRLLVWRMT